jgi:hypothetical protein
MKYFVLDGESLDAAGITHHRTSLHTFLRVSFWKKLIPIMPNLRLSTAHNNHNKCGSIGDYFDIIDKSILHELPPTTNNDDITIWKTTHGLLWDEPLFKEFLETNPSPLPYDSVFQYKLEFKHIAQNIISQLKSPVCCIHIRRSDYLKIRPSLIESTSPESVAKVLDKFDGLYNSVYIMTSEPDIHFYDSICEKYKIKQYFDFPELAEISKTDNYKLFCIENFIRDLSNIRISTFNTNNTKCYAAYLDESHGWQ